jgi:DNA repair protein RecO (recombination protein O)
MYWKDEGYLLSKNNYSENSIIIQAFTADHGNYSGIVYGGSSKKQKRIFQIGNKILLNWKSKSDNKVGYFNIELIKAISPRFFDDKRRSICILAASSILKILLPERQTNKKIYHLFEELINNLNDANWIKSYIFWEFTLIKELGFEIEFIKQNNQIEINGRTFKIPDVLINKESENFSDNRVKEALAFNKSLLIENFIIPNRLRFPNSRNILERYFQS